MSYSATAKEMRNIDLTDLGYCVGIRTKDVPKSIADLYGLDDEVEYNLLDVNEVNNEFDLSQAADWSDTWFFEEDFDCGMSGLIKKAGHYLVFARRCRWDGADGYTIVDDLKSAVQRSYECSIYPKDASRGGKALICTEYSHDVPMGATTVIVALTDREYEWLENGRFDQVKSFAEKYC